MNEKIHKTSAKKINDWKFLLHKKKWTKKFINLSEKNKMIENSYYIKKMNEKIHKPHYWLLFIKIAPTNSSLVNSIMYVSICMYKYMYLYVCINISICICVFGYVYAYMFIYDYI